MVMQFTDEKMIIFFFKNKKKLKKKLNNKQNFFKDFVEGSIKAFNPLPT